MPSLANGCNSVLEVGPGTGALTIHMLNRGDLDVHVVELDEESVEYLITEEILLATRFMELVIEVES